MDVIFVDFPSISFSDWSTFHQMSSEVFGFPDFYGQNMNAWIDCLGDVGEKNGMTKVSISDNQILVIRIQDMRSPQGIYPRGGVR